MRRLLDDLPSDLRERALTHPAFASSHAESFERLEFLGDSVLGLVVTDAIYRRFTDLPEGELTRVRAAVVSRDACAEVAERDGLGAAMVVHAEARGVAHGATVERLAGQRNALAALVESVCGASFLAFGFEAVAPRVLAAFEDRIAWALDNRVDARSRLQELVSREGADVAFEEQGEEGPPHDRRFTMSAHIAAAAGDTDGSTAATEWETLRASGTGRSKQEAQQAAAAALLALIDGSQG